MSHRWLSHAYSNSNNRRWNQKLFNENRDSFRIFHSTYCVTASSARLEIRDRLHSFLSPYANCDLQRNRSSEEKRVVKVFFLLCRLYLHLKQGKNIAHSKPLRAYVKIIEMQMPQTISHGHRCIGGWRSARLAHIFSDQMNINDPLDIRLGCDKDLHSNIITYNA